MMRRNLSRIVLPFLCLILVQCGADSSAPPEINGRWTTADESFKGEYIEISPEAITFGKGDGSGYGYRVTGVGRKKGPLYNSTLYQVRCTDDEGNENLFNFIYTPDEGGTLRYKSSQDVEWRKG